MLYRGHGPVKFGMLVASLVGLSLPGGAVFAQGAPAPLGLGTLAAASSGAPVLTGVSQSTKRKASTTKKSSTSLAAKLKSSSTTKPSATAAPKSSATTKAAKSSKSTKTAKAKKPSKTVTPPRPPQESSAPPSAVAPAASGTQTQNSGTQQGGSTTTPATVAALQGPAPLHILYNEKPSDSFTVPDVGAQMYFGVYQNTDPNAHTGQIDVPRVVEATRAIVAANPNMEWGMLDFEHPYNEVLLAGPSDPLYANAVASKVALIKAVKEEFPNIKWTYYGVPRLPYWVDGQTWSTMSETKRRELFDHAQLSYGPIMRELDWVQPTVYDKYERSMGFPLSNLAARDAAERAYRVALVEVTRDWYARNELQAKPILPAVSPWFLDASKATMFRAIPSEEMESDQLRAVIEAGAQGVSVWSGMRHKIMLATINFMPNSAFGQLSQSQARSTFASDVLGGATLTSVNWQDPAVKDALERACNEAMATMMELAKKVHARHQEALANASGGGES